MSTLSILTHSDFQIYNRKLARILGAIPAITLTELCEKRDYVVKTGRLHEHKDHGPNWFYYKIDDFEERTGITRTEQETALKKLKELGFIEHRPMFVNKENMHVRCFRINDEKILELFGLQRKEQKNDYKNDKTCNSEKIEEKSICVAQKSELVSEKMGDQSSKNKSIIMANPEIQTSDFVKFGHIIHKEKQDKRNIESTRGALADPSGSASVSAFDASLSEKKEPAQKQAFGEDGFVKLTESEFEKLAKKMGPALRDQLIEELNVYIGSVGEAQMNRKYKSHYHVILKWVNFRRTFPVGKGQGVVNPNIAPSRQNSRLVTEADKKGSVIKMREL